MAGPIRNDKFSNRQRNPYNFPYCENLDKYEKLAKIGQGTYG